MPSPNQLALSAQPHRNQQLFSDHFLNANLPRLADWQMLAADSQVKAAKARIAELLSRFTPSQVEAQTEDDLVKPVLEALGHTYEVQAALKTPDGTKKPDYVFYRDNAARAGLKGKTLDDELLKTTAFAVGDAKYWDRPLDIAIKTGTDPFNNKNPSYQIAFYVQHSGVAWGILTNGRLWRLYHKDTAHKLDRYYEVDLPSVVASNDDEAFLYFYVFFCRAAFESGAGGARALQLDALLASSRNYARSVGDTLKTQVYEALRHLAQGFLDHPQNNLTTDPATRKAIYDNALIVLYRLLFILYAEARELLPVNENDSYRDEYSLNAIKTEVKRNLEGGKKLLSTTKRLWQKLDELFDIIDKGSPPLKVGTFNGGLFDPVRHPFLKQYAVGDAQLQAAIDKLARVSGEFIDYRDLAERHLGTIYEGLLEYQVVPMAEPVDGWTIELLNDKGERKASGSYYTPDYIVKYIVDQAVGPALRKAVDGAADDGEKLKRILEVNVLDPAMGSGHFLVEVVEYIARFIVDEGITPTSAVTGEGDIAYWKRRVAQSCVYGVDLNPLAVELAKLSLWLVTVAKDRPLSFLDHHLRAGNALVGAKLADVQAFAAAPTKKTRKKASASEAQAPLFSDAELAQAMRVAVGSMWLIEENPALTVSDVKQQEQLWAQIHGELTKRYKRLADLITAQHFGVAIDPTLVRPLADRASGKTSMSVRQLDDVLNASDAVAIERRFFHWEIEFPEVFFDRDGQSLGDGAGFDAVVGNPPYVRQELLTPFKMYLQERFSDVFSGTADLFVYFFQQSQRLLAIGSRLAFVCSNSWLQTSFALPLRRFLRLRVLVETLLDLGNNRTFEEAPDVVPSIVTIKNSLPDEEHRIVAISFSRGEKPLLDARVLGPKSVHIRQSDQDDSGWILEEDVDRDVLKKLQTAGEMLKTVTDDQILMGIKTGLNEAFVINDATYRSILAESPDSFSLIHRFVRGEDLRPWYQEDERRWLIAIPCGWTSQQYGSDLKLDQAWNAFRSSHKGIANHLEPFKDAAQRRGDKGDYWWELRPCDYYAEFLGIKLVWPDIGKIPRFSAGAAGLFLGNTIYFTPMRDQSLLAYMQSRVAWFQISKICLHNKYRAGLWEYRLFTQFMQRVSVPRMENRDRTQLEQLANAISAISLSRYSLHRQVFRRIQSDLGSADSSLNQKLTAWWELSDFSAFRAEVKKSLKSDIPLKDRDDWENYLRAQQAEHARLTAEIVQLETELNAHVYRLFDLTTDEIKLIEESTKYRYGEV